MNEKSLICLEDLKAAQNAGNCICGVRKIQKLSGGACPRTPLVGMSHSFACIPRIKTLSRLLIYNLVPTFKSNDNPAIRMRELLGLLYKSLLHCHRQVSWLKLHAFAVLIYYTNQWKQHLCYYNEFYPCHLQLNTGWQ